MNNVQPEIIHEQTFQYYIPYKESKLFVKFFKPDVLSQTTCIFLVHWMDTRGHIGNKLYNQLGDYYSKEQGIPVFLFDILGSGRSQGKFEMHYQQKDQIKIVYSHIKGKLSEEFGSEMSWTIIPLTHSISVISVLTAVDEGLPITKLIWIGGPPSHKKSFDRAIKSEGHVAWYMYLLLSRLDSVSGIIGIKMRRKIFGFNLRLKDIRKYFSDAHGAKMILNHPEISVLAVFGAEDEYMNESDIIDEFGSLESTGNHNHVKIVVLEGANHSFKGKTEQLIKILNPFISR